MRSPGHAEVAADRLADALAVERPGERVGDGVGDRAVVLVAGVQRGRVVVAALEDRPGEQLHPLRQDRAQVAVDDDERLDLERGGDLEDRPQGGTLAADAVDLRVGQADPGEPVLRPDEEDLLDVVGRFGLHHDPARAVRRARVGVDEHGPEVREVLDEPGLGRPHDVSDRGGVLEAGDADHDVGLAQGRDLIADGRLQDRRRHRLHPTTARKVPPACSGCRAATAAPGLAQPFGIAATAQPGLARPGVYRLFEALYASSPKPKARQLTIQVPTGGRT